MRFSENRWEVELHLHLDGGFRPSTVYRYAKKKGIHVPGSNADEFANKLAIKQPNSLNSFLKAFDYIVPPIAGDKVCFSGFFVITSPLRPLLLTRARFELTGGH